MERTFAEELNKCILMFLDDMIIDSQTLEEHERHLRAAMEPLRARGLHAKMPNDAGSCAISSCTRVGFRGGRGADAAVRERWIALVGRPRDRQRPGLPLHARAIGARIANNKVAGYVRMDSAASDAAPVRCEDVVNPFFLRAETVASSTGAATGAGAGVSASASSSPAIGPSCPSRRMRVSISACRKQTRKWRTPEQRQQPRRQQRHHRAPSLRLELRRRLRLHPLRIL